MTMFGTKVCNDEEWKDFKSNYDRKMGEASIPKSHYEMIDAPQDTTMSEADRVELSKACTELSTANITIKNLSEVVVNFSCTGSISNHQQEKTITQQAPPQAANPT